MPKEWRKKVRNCKTPPSAHPISSNSRRFPRAHSPHEWPLMLLRLVLYNTRCILSCTHLHRTNIAASSKNNCIFTAAKGQIKSVFDWSNCSSKKFSNIALYIYIVQWIVQTIIKFSFVRSEKYFYSQPRGIAGGSELQANSRATNQFICLLGERERSLFKSL